MALYASSTDLLRAAPVVGRGSDMTTSRRAMAGMDWSTVLPVGRVESLSIMTGSVLSLILLTKGPRHLRAWF